MSKKEKPVNRSLDLQPLIGFIPADMFFPWSCILVTSLVIRGIFGFSWWLMACLSAWGMTTWWLLTYKGAWRFLSKFVAVPYWVRGNVVQSKSSNHK